MTHFLTNSNSIIMNSPILNPTILTPNSTQPIEVLLENLCPRVLFGGITRTLLEAYSEEAAAQAISLLAARHITADYYSNPNRSEWYVTIYH